MTLIGFHLNGKTIDLTADNIKIERNNFNVDKNGTVSCTNATVSGTITSNNATITGGMVQVSGGSNTGDSTGLNLKVISDNTYNYSGFAPGFGIVRGQQSKYINFQSDNDSNPAILTVNYDSNNYITATSGSWGSSIICHSASNMTQISASGITTPTVTQTSREENKKNFEKLENALDILKATDIYKYNFKEQKDGEKKHIGFVIGENYNYSHEITAEDKDEKEIGVDNYSMTSVLWKAVQEQQEIIENLQKQIDDLKGE